MTRIKEAISYPVWAHFILFSFSLRFLLQILAFLVDYLCGHSLTAPPHTPGTVLPVHTHFWHLFSRTDSGLGHVTHVAHETASTWTRSWSPGALPSRGFLSEPRCHALRGSTWHLERHAGNCRPGWGPSRRPAPTAMCVGLLGSGPAGLSELPQLEPCIQL